MEEEKNNSSVKTTSSFGIITFLQFLGWFNFSLSSIYFLVNMDWQGSIKLDLTSIPGLALLQSIFSLGVFLWMAKVIETLINIRDAVVKDK